MDAKNVDSILLATSSLDNFWNETDCNVFVLAIRRTEEVLLAPDSEAGDALARYGITLSVEDAILCFTSTSVLDEFARAKKEHVGDAIIGVVLGILVYFNLKSNTLNEGRIIDHYKSELQRMESNKSFIKAFDRHDLLRYIRISTGGLPTLPSFAEGVLHAPENRYIGQAPIKALADVVECIAGSLFHSSVGTSSGGNGLMDFEFKKISCYVKALYPNLSALSIATGIPSPSDLGVSSPCPSSISQRKDTLCTDLNFALDDRQSGLVSLALGGPGVSFRISKSRVKVFHQTNTPQTY